MKFIVQRLLLGLLLIGGTSAVLLLSDSDRRRQKPDRLPHVALLQFATSPLMEYGVLGMKEGLKERGFVPGSSIDLKIFNAEGDMPTANAIASEITNGQYDLIMTSGTPALQAVANANRNGKTIHVFGLVADPPGAGVGIHRDNLLEHPPHLVGIGSFVPVSPAFELAREMFPGLKSVGVVWNPAESNSEAFTLEARKICSEMDLELLEATVDGSAGVFEAASSLVARGVQALWISGDNAVAAAAQSVISAARAGKIPVFSILSGNAELGALFEAGADFQEVGRETGHLAARILQGADPAKIPVVNSVPEKLVVNQQALQGLHDPWTLTPDILKRAQTVIDENGATKTSKATTEARTIPEPLAKTWSVSMLSFVEAPSTEETEQGVFEGLDEALLKKGQDYQLHRMNAQGDIATASALVDAAVTRGSDLLISISTPALQAVLARAPETPLVFTLVANPILAGAGQSNQDHSQHVTGVFTISPFDEMMAVMRECLPGIRRVGTLFAPAEVNSVFYKDLMLEAARKADIEVELIGVSSSSEVADAALSLCSRNIEVVCQISDNLSASTFVSIAEAARRFKLPIFSFNSSHTRQGAAVVVARDFYEGGRQAGLLAARVMRGESPGSIPFEPTTKLKIAVNLEAAAESGLQIPSSLRSRASEIIGQS